MTITFHLTWRVFKGKKRFFNLLKTSYFLEGKACFVNKTSTAAKKKKKKKNQASNQKGKIKKLRARDSLEEHALSFENKRKSFVDS